MAKRRTPSHPGGILRRLYLEPLSLSVTDLAKALKVSRANKKGEADLA